MKDDELATLVIFHLKITEGQLRTCLWYDHQIGRIIASMFSHACKCAETKYSTTLVKSIMQYSYVADHARVRIYGVSS